MLKKFLIVISSLLVSLTMTYFFIHIYDNPTCLKPSTCIICHKTKGEALGHEIQPATCTNPSYCLRCNEILSEALGHDWKNLTNTYQICERCQKNDGFLSDLNVKDCDYYLVYNFEYDQILYDHNKDQSHAPASLTKLLTISLALQYLDIDETVTVGEEIELLKPNSSTAHLKQGQQLTIKQLLEACLLPSGNDAAYVLAYQTAKKTHPEILNREEGISVFLSMMNDYAKELGCSNSHFETPDGYDSDHHYSCLSDLLRIAKKAYSQDIVREIAQKKRVKETLSDGTSFIWSNSNNMLYEEESQYSDVITGLKTGYTGSAGRCIIVTCEKGDLTYMVLVLGCADIETRTKTVEEILDLIY